MDQDHRPTALDHAEFDATRWSLVLEAAQGRAEAGPEALAQLCERYWPPLYAFARHRGFSPEDAQDLVQGFFEQPLSPWTPCEPFFSRALARPHFRGANASSPK
jgi:hypothetical protein